jgi:hypothetical protein
MENKPFLSSRSIIEDYSLLLEYMKKCKNKGLDCSNIIPTSQTLDELLEKIEKGAITFEQLLDYIKGKYENQVYCDLCVEAFKQVFNIAADCEDSRRMLLIQLTGWYVEILETLGYVKLKSAWKP